MRYVKFGPTGLTVSALGLGTMRLPTRGKVEELDEEKALELICYAVEKGINYIDTAYLYHGGNSEKILGKALEGGLRKKVLVATKLPVWRVETKADFDRFLNEQLERLQTDYLDFYLLHNLHKTTWRKAVELGVLEWSEKAREEGRFRFFGFSFHDKLEVFQEILNSYKWDMCQIQYNYVCEDFQAGTRGLKLAYSRDVPVVVMEPLLGGCLANPPPQVKELIRESFLGIDPVEIALKWLWDKKEVSCVLSGMSSKEQVDQNVGICERSEAGCLSEEEASLVERLLEAYKALSPVPCTNCSYCMPCPNGVDIPVNIQLFNSAKVHGEPNFTLCKYQYKQMPDEAKAASCTSCRECEDKCPQKIEISRVMEEISKTFAVES